MAEFAPDWVLPPGAIIAAEMRARGQTAFAVTYGAPFSALDLEAVIDGCAPVTPKIATWLEQRWGTPATFWLRLEHLWQTHQARQHP